MSPMNIRGHRPSPACRMAGSQPPESESVRGRLVPRVCHEQRHAVASGTKISRSLIGTICGESVLRTWAMQAPTIR